MNKLASWRNSERASTTKKKKTTEWRRIKQLLGKLWLSVMWSRQLKEKSRANRKRTCSGGDAARKQSYATAGASHSTWGTTALVFFVDDTGSSSREKISAKSFPVASFPTLGKPLLSLLFRIREKGGWGGESLCFFLLFSIFFADRADKHEARCGRCWTLRPNYKHEQPAFSTKTQIPASYPQLFPN